MLLTVALKPNRAFIKTGADVFTSSHYKADFSAPSRQCCHSLVEATKQLYTVQVQPGWFGPTNHMFKSPRLLLALIFGLVSAPMALAEQVPIRLEASATSLTPPQFIGTHMYLTASGSGKSSHLGKITFVAPHDFDLVNGTYVSDAYVKAANGDILHLITLGQFINPVDSIGNWVAAGGTGRFAGATGSGTALNLNFGQSITFEGTISTVGSGH
jgi:hypothetical protein